MQAAMKLVREIPVIKPTESAARPYALRYRIDGVRAELNFTSDDARAAKAAELINFGRAVVFFPSQS